MNFESKVRLVVSYHIFEKLQVVRCRQLTYAMDTEIMLGVNQVIVVEIRGEELGRLLL